VVSDFFKTSCQSLFKIWNKLRQVSYLDDLLILTNRNNRFKDHVLKFEMVQARLSTSGMRLNISNLSSLQNKYNTWDTGSPDKVFNLNITRMRKSLMSRRPKQEKRKQAKPVYWYSQLISRHVVSLSRSL
jgi:hypothetical protein